MRVATLLLSAALPCLLAAQTYLSERFAGSAMPKTFTIVNADGLEVQPYIYYNIGKELDVAWTPRQLAGGYGRAAFAPTRKTQEDVATSAWMILPSLHIADAGAVLRWEARSLHKHIAESYRVAIRPTGSLDWTDLYVCPAESHVFTKHIVELDAYLGQDVEIAFEANTVHGFILAVDNIFVGVPDDNPFSYESSTPHYVSDSEKVQVTGSLSYYGSLSPWSELVLEGFDGTQRISLPPLNAGETIDVEFDVYPSLGKEYRYTLSAVAGTDTTVVHSDFMSCSYFRSNKLIDRLSGTWCNNCPQMELTITRLERLYRDQLIVVEAHIGDVLVNNDYRTGYLGSEVYAIPSLIAEHNLNNVIYSVKSTDDLSAAFAKETIAMVELEASMAQSEPGSVNVKSHTTFALDTDNSADRYRVAYMLVGDIHERYNGFYLQTSSPTSYNSEQFYYQPSSILPEMMYFENLPLDASVAYRGVAASLPADIKKYQPSAHSHTLTVPKATEAKNFKVIAMVIDTTDNTIINAAIAPVTDVSGITDIVADSVGDCEAEYYDITGRKVSAEARGLIIKRKGQNITKTIIK